ncbi:MAG: diguanylate cyclase [Deltaproteobacteria bacterium]|nr:diguanylate cyclase [Deltaproteobacteria bacterium]
MKILIAEDNLVSRRLLRTHLEKWGYKVLCVCNGEEALELLQQEDAPKLAILDWMMPKMDGVEVCRQIRTRNNNSYVYIILFTAKEGDKNLIEAMNAGADDFISKSASRDELKARLRAGKRILALEEKLFSNQEKLRSEAMHDQLTGLLNHAAILDLLDRELDRAKRDGTFLSVAMADLDHFKHVNDTNGHLSGDIVLREAANRISRSVRLYDAVGRYGGEEFLIVMPGCEEKAGLAVAERILHGMCEKPCALPNAIVPVTVSIGVAAMNFEDSEAGAESMLRSADLALYQAKSSGRNRVVAAKDLEETLDNAIPQKHMDGCRFSQGRFR